VSITEGDVALTCSYSFRLLIVVGLEWIFRKRKS